VKAGWFTDFLNFHEANLGFDPSAPVRQPYTGPKSGA
jgi:hypothetical protein